MHNIGLTNISRETSHFWAVSKVKVLILGRSSASRSYKKDSYI